MNQKIATTIAVWIGLALVAGPIAARAEEPTPGAAVLRLRYVTELVRDYDEALAWYTHGLGLQKLEDRPFGPGRRWLVVGWGGPAGVGIVLDIPHGDTIKQDRIGKESNWVFDVTDCDQFYEEAKRRGVHFLQSPQQQPWGTTQAIFDDPYGNIYVAESSRKPASGGAPTNP